MHNVIVLGMLACSMPAQCADRIQVGIRVEAPRNMPASLLNAVVAETERLWKFASLTIHWHQLEKPFSNPDNRLLIVRFVGECSVMRAEGRHEGPLGYTHVSDSKVLPFIDVNCGAVGSSLLRKHRDGMFIRRDMYARALAAVLTHEMVHALTESRAHYTAGVMQPQLTPDELEQEETGLIPPVIEHLEEALHVTLSDTRNR